MLWTLIHLLYTNACVLTSFSPPNGRLTRTLKPSTLVALRDSDILNRIRLALVAAGLDPVDYDMLGDKLYVNAQNICRLYKEPMNDQARVDNAIDSSVRTCVEWSNNCISSRWMSLAFKRRLQIQLSDVKRQVLIFTSWC